MAAHDGRGRFDREAVKSGRDDLEGVGAETGATRPGDSSTGASSRATRRLGVGGLGVLFVIAYWRALQPNAEGKRRIAVNLRLADPQAVADVPIDHFDGFDTWQDLPRDGRCVRDYWF